MSLESSLLHIQKSNKKLMFHLKYLSICKTRDQTLCRLQQKVSDLKLIISFCIAKLAKWILVNIFNKTEPLKSVILEYSLMFYKFLKDLWEKYWFLFFLLKKINITYTTKESKLSLLFLKKKYVCCFVSNSFGDL